MPIIRVSLCDPCTACCTLCNIHEIRKNLHTAHNSTCDQAQGLKVPDREASWEAEGRMAVQRFCDGGTFGPVFLGLKRPLIMADITRNNDDLL